MNNLPLSFCTAIEYDQPSWTESIYQASENYFNFSDESGFALRLNLSNHFQVYICESKSPLSEKILKVASLFTIVIPLIMAAIKICHRLNRTFHQNVRAEPNPINLRLEADEKYRKNVKAAAQPTAAPQGMSADINVKGLMETFTKLWDATKKDFAFPKNVFNTERFISLLKKQAASFKKPDIDYHKHHGFIDKFDLNPKDNPVLFVRADTHGDLKSLMENLRTLQKEGHLDDHFKCKPGVHLLFLGDYCDRGNYGTQILEMLMRLREENPQQVHLLRGNHESIETNLTYGTSDHNLMQCCRNENGPYALQTFYETLSLTSYFSLDVQGQREYSQGTHGLFEPYMDPAPLLDSKEKTAYLPVPIIKDPKLQTLSDRISKIAADPQAPLYKSAQRIQEILKDTPIEVGRTHYNWGDVIEGNTALKSSSSRSQHNGGYKLNAEDISHYLKLSSADHRVKMLLRGHEHKFKHLMHEGEVLVTTLTVGMDSIYQHYFEQMDRAYIIRLKPKVSEWTKQAVLRKAGNLHTDEITEQCPLTADEELGSGPD